MVSSYRGPGAQRRRGPGSRVYLQQENRRAPAQAYRFYIREEDGREKVFYEPANSSTRRDAQRAAEAFNAAVGEALGIDAGDAREDDWARFLAGEPGRSYEVGL